MNRSYSDDLIVDPYVGWPEVDVLSLSTLIPLGPGRGRRLPKLRTATAKVKKSPQVKKARPETPPEKRRNRQALRRQCALHRVIQALGSQAELARRLGMKQSQGSTIRWWVTQGVVPAKWIHKVATVGNVSVGELMADWSNHGVKHGR